MLLFLSGYLNLLAQLTSVGDISELEFQGDDFVTEETFDTHIVLNILYCYPLRCKRSTFEEDRWMDGQNFKCKCVV
jgi:hypothetical protein